MEELIGIIPMQYILLIGGLMVIGEMLKKYTTLPNNLLTAVLPLLGAIACTFTYLCDSDVFLIAELISAMNTGLCCGFASTGGYEFFMNTFVKKENVKKVINICEKVVETVEEAALEDMEKDNETVEIEEIEE